MSAAVESAVATEVSTVETPVISSVEVPSNKSQLMAEVETAEAEARLDSRRIGRSDTVVVRNIGDRSCYILQIDGESKIGKTRVVMNDLVGDLYGARYELNGRKFQRLDVSVDQALVGLPMNESDELDFNNFSDNDIHRYLHHIASASRPADVIKGDNSFYSDTNTAQRLTDTDIEKLRAEGLSGEEMIKTLIQNSDTFGAKTDFAQMKWISRKEKKYRPKFQVLRATPYSVSEASYMRNREKVMGMRYDVLGQVLSQAGVHAGSDVLVVESMTGMMVGALAYRMRGHGRILAMYGTQQPHMEMVRTYNLAADYQSIIEPVPATELGPAARDVCQKGFEEIRDLPRKTTGMYEDTVPTEENSKKRRRILETAPMYSTGRSPIDALRVRSYLRQGVNSLIIASKYRPLPVLKQALCLLAPSSPFVIFHEFLEPLVDCYLWLQESGMAIRLNLADSWLREFQNLPGRFRPDMFMAQSGGFFLSGYYVGIVPRPYPSLVDEKEISALVEAKSAEMNV